MPDVGKTVREKGAIGRYGHWQTILLRGPGHGAINRRSERRAGAGRCPGHARPPFLWLIL